MNEPRRKYKVALQLTISIICVIRMMVIGFLMGEIIFFCRIIGEGISKIDSCETLIEVAFESVPTMCLQL